MAARIQKELKDLSAKEIWSIEAEDLYKWDVVFHGPTACQSPYEGGSWVVQISFPSDYPWKPPKVKFTTKIFHPNISDKGEVCDKSFAEGWVPKNTIGSTIIPFIETLLLDLDPGNPMNPAASELLVNDQKAFNKKAIEWTKKYAS